MRCDIGLCACDGVRCDIGLCACDGVRCDIGLCAGDVCVCLQADDTGGVPVGQPRVPMVVACSGDGSYLHPYYVDLTDPLVVAGVKMFGRQWSKLIVDLNDTLRMVCVHCCLRTRSMRCLQ